MSSSSGRRTSTALVTPSTAAPAPAAYISAAVPATLPKRSIRLVTFCNASSACRPIDRPDCGFEIAEKRGRNGLWAGKPPRAEPDNLELLLFYEWIEVKKYEI